VHDLAFLVGDDQEDVGLAWQVAEGHGIPHSLVVRFASTRSIGSAVIGLAPWFCPVIRLPSATWKSA
jgi:hypothetical protein